MVLPAGCTVEGNNATFNECGNFEIIYYLNDSKGNNTVAKRSVKVRNIYNCYFESATLPVLYSALDMATNNYKSILTFTRTDTINVDVLGDRFIYVANGAGDRELNEAKRLAVAIAKKDENSYFRLFITAEYNQLEIFTFMQNEIPYNRYEVKLLSDGGYTYNSAFPYREDGSYDLWERNKDIYYGVLDKAYKGEFIELDNGMYTIEYNGDVITSGYTDGPLDKMAIMAAQRENVEMWCGYPETLISKDKRVQAEIEKAHMPKMAPDEMYAKLSDEQKTEFLKIVNFDKDDFDARYFDREGEYLIITGTNPFTGSLKDSEFAEILKRIIKDYSGYNILYKPHPSALAPDGNSPLTDAVLKENNIKLLPGRLPMEVISWVYSDVKLGGFDSSLFMAVPQGNTEFFIARNADALSQLSKQLYNDGAFGSPEFYWTI